MPDFTPDTHAGDTKRSSTGLTRLGRSARRSGRDVVARSETPIVRPSSETSSLVLAALLAGVTRNTSNGDVIALGVYAAGDICKKLGVSDDDFDSVVTRYLAFSDTVRRGNPMAF